MEQAPQSINVIDDGHGDKKPIRGAINVDVSTSEPVISAASEFSIFVIIRNPYNVPITVYSAQTHIPIALKDMVWENNYRIHIANDRKRRYEEEVSRMGKLGLRISFFWNDIVRKIRSQAGRRIAEAVDTNIEAISSLPVETTTTIRMGDIMESSNIVVGDFSELWSLKFQTIPSNEELDRLFRRIEDYRSGKAPILLHPGNALVKQFILRAKDTLFFSPLEYTFQIQIKYIVDGMEQLEVVPYRLSIRAAISSTIIGSIIGGILGAIAQTLSNKQQLIPGTVILAAIFSAVTAVAFARKTNTQQLVSVEDFWGGVFVGFLVGYLGESFFRSLLGR